MGVGVCYKKDSERKSHYVDTSLAKHSDAHVFVYRTRALTPLRGDCSYTGLNVIAGADPLPISCGQPQLDHQAALGPSPFEEVQIGCKCGFSCGTRRALDKHLSRFPDDNSHEPYIVGSQSGPRL